MDEEDCKPQDSKTQACVGAAEDVLAAAPSLSHGVWGTLDVLALGVASRLKTQ